MRTGILGGTFNPIHLAHLRIAEEAREACALDRVLFIPAADPPHKLIENGVPFERRLHMVTLAIADHPAFSVSDLEGRRPGKSYSVHTLDILHRQYPGDDFYFIVGLDSYRDFGSWREYGRLFELANIVVVSRPEFAAADLRDLLPVAIQGEFCYDCAARTLRHRSGRSVFFLDDVRLDISSTRIRQLTAAGHSIRHLVPAAVAAYIRDNGLYRGAERI